jgi:hypothetical protein
MTSPGSWLACFHQPQTTLMGFSRVIGRRIHSKVFSGRANQKQSPLPG